MWKAVGYQPEDLPEAIAMAREYYGESWISDPGYLKWQYEENPCGPAVIQLARDEDSNRLAGQYAVIPQRFRVYGQTVKGVLSLNTLTREAYAGQGIFTGLAQAVYQDCAEQGAAFCYGLPNPNSYPGFTKKLGFSDLGRVPLLLRPLNVKAIVRKKIGPWLAPLALPFQYCFRLKDPSSRKGRSGQPPLNAYAPSALTVTPLTPFQLSEFDAFWLKIQDKYPIMGIRDAAFIRWRYFTNPYRDYQLYGVHRKEGSTSELVGYIAGRCTEVAGMASGMVVDFLVEPNLPAAGDLLLDRLLHFFAANNMDLAGSLLLPHTEEYRLLKAGGFFTCPKALEPQPFPLIFRRLASGESRRKESGQSGQSKQSSQSQSVNLLRPMNLAAINLAEAPLTPSCT